MFVITYRKLFFILSAVLTGISIFAMVYWGFNLGIDFKGGSITEVSYPGNRPAFTEVKMSVEKLSLGEFILSPVGEKNFTIKTKDLTPAEKSTLIQALSLDGRAPLKEERFNSIGPVVGAELKNKAFLAIAVVILCIVLFVTFAFRKVSYPVASWKYGLATIIALAHDVAIPTGVFIIFIKFYGGEIDLLFVTAILAILGYSVHDTIVVFDRVREHLRLNQEIRNKENFETTVGKSVSETFGRSINTSLTIFLVLVALYFIGGESTRNFAFVLLVGVIAGTYSSIFLASPLLVTLEKIQSKTK